MSADAEQKSKKDSTSKILYLNKPDNNKQLKAQKPSCDKEIPSPFNNNKNSINHSKTNETYKVKRFDIMGNEICKNGKQKVTFIDKVTEKGFKEYINVESFKDYNKVEEINLVQHNGCCLIE